MCAAHWGSLKDAIAVRGLSSLVAKSGEEVVSRVSRAQSDGSSIDTFEPLMGAHNAIVQRLLGIGGLSIVAPNDDGSERCPLCFANERHEATCTDPACTWSYDHFIDKAADQMVDDWKALQA